MINHQKIWLNICILTAKTDDSRVSFYLLFDFEAMKNIHIYPVLKNIAILTIALIWISPDVISQPAYPPWLFRTPYRQEKDPRFYPGSERRNFNPWMHSGNMYSDRSIGIHFDPLISWFSTDSYDVRSEGAVPGISFGISCNRYISHGFSFSSGINIISAGGKLISKVPTCLELKNYTHEMITVSPGEVITYKINYLSVPLGFKFETNRMDYGMFFADFGFDPKIVIGGRADIPSLRIRGNALPELRTFNLSYHFIAGMEYPLGEYNTIILGVGFENTFSDITRDKGDQMWDRVSQKILSFRFGISF